MIDDDSPLAGLHREMEDRARDDRLDALERRVVPSSDDVNELSDLVDELSSLVSKLRQEVAELHVRVDVLEAERPGPAEPEGETSNG